MFLAAFVSLRSQDSKAFYDRERTESKGHNAALICLARRHCNVTSPCSAPGRPTRPAQAGGQRGTQRQDTRRVTHSKVT